MSELTQKLARLGGGGRHPGNLERDLYRTLRLPVPPFYIEVPARCQKNRRDIILKRVPLLLPHEVYQYLFESCNAIVIFF